MSPAHPTQCRAGVPQGSDKITLQSRHAIFVIMPAES